VREHPVDDVALFGVDKADDLHGAAAAGALRRIDLPVALDQGRPATVGNAARCVIVVDFDDVAPLAVGPGSQAAGRVRVPAEVADQVLVRFGDVRGELGDEVERIEDLEVAGHTAEEVGAGGPEEPAAGPLVGDVENLALGGHLDQALQTERTAEHVLVAAVEQDLISAYGAPPPSAVTLLRLAELRVLATMHAVRSVTRLEGDSILTVLLKRLRPEAKVAPVAV
jgi:hypothetical protein